MGNQLKEFISIMLIKTYDKIQLNHPGEVAILDKTCYSTLIPMAIVL